MRDHRQSLRLLPLAFCLLAAMAASTTTAFAAISSGTLVGLDPAGRNISIRDSEEQSLNFRVSQRASIHRNGQRVQLGDLVLGDAVVVQYDRDRGLVRHLAAEGDAVEILRGLVVRVNISSLVVDLADGPQLTVLVDTNTRISRNGRSARLAELTTSDAAAVAMRPATQVAASIVANGPEVNEVQGTITALTDDSLTVLTPRGREVAFGITADTRVEIDGQPGTLADLAVGQRAEVHFSPATREAFRIEIGRDVENDEARMTGSVTAVNTAAATLTLRSRSGATRTFRVRPSTVIRIDGDDGALADIRVGDRARVEFDPATRFASRIVVPDRGDD